ncbi:MAG: DNA polymerase III subunit delta' [Rhodospirillales bacterium]|nr:DNA polymerase III subunit delta' [Rhodospirillales bacterium]HIJ42675.1 DNA polymerase III subunit delta' [Rhodospirillaceae bacterium]MDP7214479.1 DNA polymerase III subunit delta' [Rhodospirillales bacterium]HIJ46321.1 DNA polymerase III subunit delta' [Rhodospirillaceae bacterium]HIJ91802.1 DNA polymerase III subunit delta' [Rhodospirillaceae bacterium]
MSRPEGVPSGESGPPPPRKTPDLVGHAEAEKVLFEAFHRGRLVHAWLICGPRGIGKATLAFRFARFVLARGAGEAATGALFGGAPPAAAENLYVGPSEPVFRRVASGGHADLLTIERTAHPTTGKMRSEIAVDDIRGIAPFLSLTAAEGGWRVVVIDGADEMNANSANALLKTLEEPPKRGLFLLVAHNPGNLPATIRSRCRMLRLKPLAEDHVAALAARFSPDLTAGEATELARLAEGSPGRALALAKGGGLGLYGDLLALLQSLPRLDVTALHEFAGRLGRAGADDLFAAATDLLRWWLGRLIVFAANGGGTPPVGTPAAELALMRRLAAASSLDRWLEVWEKINRLLALAGGAKLERKQVILSVFHALENAAR